MTKYDILADNSRVWIYQSDRAFTASELPQVRQYLQQFAQRWVSHNRDLHAYADVFHNQFIVLMVDESHAGASGCSIDASVHFLQQLQAEFGVYLFDRMTFAYQDEAGVKTAKRDEFKTLYQAGKIEDDTLVFDNLVNTKAQFQAAWVKPLKESWHKRMV
ncbi:MAG: hypothetical protein AAF849_07315 [Bacteroidota bacterium]